LRTSKKSDKNVLDDVVNSLESIRAVLELHWSENERELIAWQKVFIHRVVFGNYWNLSIFLQ